jgi:tRNA1(Val) A37 N6-methylase TrmN6
MGGPLIGVSKRRSTPFIAAASISSSRRRDTHRSGVDATILAAAVPAGFSGTLADLGSGRGAAAFSVLDRCREAKAVLYENRR